LEKCQVGYRTMRECTRAGHLEVDVKFFGDADEEEDNDLR